MSNHSIKCTCALNRLSVNDFISVVSLIQSNLSADQYNMVVPSPLVVLPMLDQLATMQAQCNLKNYQHVGSRNALRAAIYNLVKGQCCSVNGLAQDDLNYMESTGFKLSKERTAAPAPEKGCIVSITNLDNNSVSVKVKYLPHTKCYELKVSGQNNYSKAVIGLTTKTLVERLPAGVPLSIKVRAVNSKGKGLWSAPIDFVVNIRPDTILNSSQN